MSLLQDTCAHCKKTSNLELNFEGKDKLCKTCLITNFENYKQLWLPVCQENLNVLDKYKKDIDSISQQLTANLKQINYIQDQIEETYLIQIRKLNQEKMKLLNEVNECKKDNEKFFVLKNELNSIIQSFNDFKDPAQNLYEDNVVNTLVKNFEQNYQKVQQIDKTYNNLISQPIKKIDRFDMIPVPPDSSKSIGYINISSQSLKNSFQTTSALGSLVRTMDPVRETTTLLSSSYITGPRSIYPNIINNRSSLDSCQNPKNFENWTTKTTDNPYQEVYLDKMPCHIACYRNYLFCVDDKGILCVFTISCSKEIDHKNNFKIPIPNVRNIAVNNNYFAIAYSDLEKKHVKSKKIKPNGVILFKRDLEYVSFNSEKPIELGNGECFESPIGIAMNSQFIYVSDKKLRSVFKIEIESGRVHNRIDITYGEPYKLSINDNYLVLTDTLQHKLTLHNIDNLQMIKELLIEQPDGRNGPFGVFITSDNIIFFKNYQGAQLTIVDIDLSTLNVFKRIDSDIQGFTIVECPNQLQILIVGGVERKGSTKLICYSNK